MGEHPPQRGRSAEAAPLPRHGQGGVGQPPPPEVRVRRAHQGRVRRLRARRRRPARLDDGRRPPVHHAAEPAAPQHRRPVRPPAAGRRRRPRAAQRHRAAASSAGWPTRCGGGGASPASPGSAGTRRWTCWPAGCARPRATGWRSTSRAGASRTRPTTWPARRRGPWAWPAIDSAARVCHAPSTVGLKATIGVAASTCSLQDVLESRPRGAVGHQPGEQPAGVHEAPLPGQEARVPCGRGQPVPRARPRVVLGAVVARVGACSARRSATCTCRCGPAATWRSPTPCSSG